MGTLKAKVDGNWVPLEFGGGPNPQNALGIVAVGSYPATVPYVLTSAFTAVSNVLSVTLQVGRRYRIVVQIRAMDLVGAATNARFSMFDGEAALVGNYYVWVGGTYQALHGEWLVDGDGLAHSYTLRGLANPGINVYRDQPTSLFYVEDIGPNAAPALPLPPTPQAWTALPFGTGWRSYGGGGTAFGVCGYRRIGDIVSLRGLAEANTGSGTITSLIGAVPVGFRPPLQLMFGQVTSKAGSAERVDVLTDGTINISGAAPPNASWVALNGIEYSVTP